MHDNTSKKKRALNKNVRVVNTNCYAQIKIGKHIQKGKSSSLIPALMVIFVPDTTTAIAIGRWWVNFYIETIVTDKIAR